MKKGHHPPRRFCEYRVTILEAMDGWGHAAFIMQQQPSISRERAVATLKQGGGKRPLGKKESSIFEF